MYIYIYTYICVYIYIYRERERVIIHNKVSNNNKPITNLKMSGLVRQHDLFSKASTFVARTHIRERCFQNEWFSKEQRPL